MLQLHNYRRHIVLLILNVLMSFKIVKLCQPDLLACLKTHKTHSHYKKKLFLWCVFSFFSTFYFCFFMLWKFYFSTLISFIFYKLNTCLCSFMRVCISLNFSLTCKICQRGRMIFKFLVIMQTTYHKYTYVVHTKICNYIRTRVVS